MQPTYTFRERLSIKAIHSIHCYGFRNIRTRFWLLMCKLFHSAEEKKY